LALLVQGDRSIEALASSTLATWAEAGGALAPAAALRLATRDSRAFRARLRQLLDGTSPSLRAQVALGLGASPEPDATYLLVERFRFEPEAIVRAAIVRGLSQRPEKLRLPTLRQAALLDPDERVRALATSALAGRKLAAPLFARGPAEVAWVTLRANSEGEREAVVRRPVEVRRADGLVVPMVSAPDGVVLVVGLREGERYDLAIVPQAPPKAPVVAPAAPPTAPPAATPEAETEPLAPAPLPDEAQPDGG
ncbi:MAG: HEAT repeat domain-containing protein, partial [Myxococcales bacterium]|nr:HEAT repeat domain-containing protein [Myxococcales bacterium]